MIQRIIRLLDLVSRPQRAYAHCDVPCGIYEADTLVHAADTVEAMAAKINELQHPVNDKPDKEFHNTLSRMVMTKEHHAQVCKDQMLILWTDHFKPEHLAKFPGLHEKIWKAVKLCSEAKRTTSVESAQKLKVAAQEIAKMFEASK